MRYQQYEDALAKERAFQKRYLFPVEVSLGKKKTILVEADEGITPTSREAIASLHPVNPGGIHSFAAQTHPADGNSVVAVCSREKARELADPDGPEIQGGGYGCASGCAAGDTGASLVLKVG